MTRPRLLLYCQHSLGLGHLARSLAIAGALADRYDVVLANGGRLPAGLRVPPGLRVVNLPPLGHDGGYELVSLDPRFTVAAACAERRRLLLELVERERPAVVVVELYPFGRKKFEFELLPLLEHAHRQRPRPLVLCSLRDILVRSRRDQARHDERARARAEAWFDAILVHTDPAFARLEESFTPKIPLRVPVLYTGFVAPRSPRPATGEGARRPRLLVSAGGGMVGEPLVREAVRVHARLAERTGLTTTVVAGPFLPDPAWRWLRDAAAASPLLEAVRQVSDLCGEIADSTLSLSQAGYNTAMDLLQAGTPAVVVPYSDGREDEQSLRARRLEALGVVRSVPAAELGTDRLLDELVALAGTRPPPSRLDLDGAAATARVVARLAGPADGPFLPDPPEPVLSHGGAR